MRVKISVKAFAAAAALAACSILPGCASWKRVGTDVAVVATSPATIVLSSFHDALDWGPDSSGAVPILLAPLNVPAHMLKHVAYTVVYAADLCASPIYLLTTITPQNHEDLAPIALYSLSDGYPWKSAPWPVFED
jgi:hypothetical protein